MGRVIVCVMTMIAAIGCTTKAQVRAMFPRYTGGTELPGEWNDQFLYWCADVKPGTFWPVYGELPESCVDVRRGMVQKHSFSVNAEGPLMEETLEAINYINEKVGWELLVYEGSNFAPDVAVVEEGFHPRAAAIARHYTDDTGRSRGYIEVFNDYASKDRSDIIAHELGHILGLKHDRFNMLSLMFPFQASRLAQFEGRDIEALRWMYAH